MARVPSSYIELLTVDHEDLAHVWDEPMPPAMRKEAMLFLAKVIEQKSGTKFHAWQKAMALLGPSPSYGNGLKAAEELEQVQPTKKNKLLFAAGLFVIGLWVIVRLGLV